MEDASWPRIDPINCLYISRHCSFVLFLHFHFQGLMHRHAQTPDKESGVSRYLWASTNRDSWAHGANMNSLVSNKTHTFFNATFILKKSDTCITSHTVCAGLATELLLYQPNCLDSLDYRKMALSIHKELISSVSVSMQHACCAKT